MSEVLMPQLGETVTEGTITKWFKAIGDTVAIDEVLFEVSTDKVDSEVPSPAAGVLAEIRVPEGETVDVGAVLAVLSADGAAPADAPPPAAAPPAAEPEAAAPPAPTPPPAPPEATPPPPPPAPAAPVAAAPVAAAPVVAAAAPVAAGEPKLLSPIVRRLIETHDLDPDQIVGTGAGGRITRSDVQKAVESGAARRSGVAAAPVAPPAAAAPAMPAPVATPAAPAPVAPPAPAAAPVPVHTGAGDTVVPLNRIRKLTGDHMVMSKSVSPHVLTAVEVDFEGVEQVRKAVKAGWKAEEGFSLTYLPFIARAVADAIAEFPHLNASVGDGELVVHGAVNLAIAVDLDFDGLLAPVVQAADTKRLRAIAREVRDLATRARNKQLTPDELSGGTFTITNPGQYGTMMQFPIINQPQVAILSTDGIRRKPVVVVDDYGNETIGIHSVGVLALAWDHRAFDGAYIAAFLDRVRTIIETRDWNPEVI